MRWTRFLAICVLILNASVTLGGTLNEESQTVMLSIRGVIERPALWSNAGGTKAVVLMHQSGATPQSWELLVDCLKSAGVSSLATFSTSGEDGVAAVEFLETQGITEITLLGASIGGGGVQQAASRLGPDRIDRVILLATANGHALTSSDLPKLFIHARQDFFVGRSIQSFKKAAEPKTLVEFSGALHGQDLLQGQDRRFVEQLILSFITN
jgi:pimeloyl-ACP methyl ester carboxylesterase